MSPAGGGAAANVGGGASLARRCAIDARSSLYCAVIASSVASAAGGGGTAPASLGRIFSVFDAISSATVESPCGFGQNCDAPRPPSRLSRSW